MGQIIERPVVITEGKNIEDYRAMLRDAQEDVIAACHQLGLKTPLGNALIEQIPVEVDDVLKTARSYPISGKHRYNFKKNFLLH
ncbi:MAG: type II toxin-antitoxin system HicB family antitoxin [Desulfobacterales bacterium]|jgi:hypothetical protein|nr:type II toxin-antitoxin system HicB family antitoxin [Desulfobacterales bacterium]